MNPKHTTLAVAALALGLALPLAACSSDEAADAPATTTTASTAAPGSKTFEVNTSSGQASISLDGELPPGWPTDFPVPDGAEPAGSGSLGNSDETVRVGVFSTTEAAKDAFAFYTDNPDLTVSDDSSVGAASAFVGKMSISGSYDGSVAVVARDGSTYIVVVLTDSGTSDTSGSSDTSGATTSDSSAA